MEIGASSSCFYPLETEKSFLNIANLGFEHAEIFFNSPSELEKGFIRDLRDIKASYNIDVVSIHPFMSFVEGYNFFSSYKRRFLDNLEIYKRFFDAGETLGAKYCVLHGSKNRIDITLEEYANRFGELNEVAKQFGMNVIHENVVHYVSAFPEFMFFMKKYLGDEFKICLDIKQARRADVIAKDFIDTMGKNIVHVHVSDFDKSHDCLPPGENGMFDFREFFKNLNDVGFEGKYIVELYSENYKNQSEIFNSAVYLDNILKEIKG